MGGERERKRTAIVSMVTQDTFLEAIDSLLAPMEDLCPFIYTQYYNTTIFFSENRLEYMDTRAHVTLPSLI